MTSLPPSWRMCLLEEVAEVRAGRTPKGLDRYLGENPRNDRTVPLFKVGDMNEHASELRRARTYLAPGELRQLGVVPVPVDAVVFPKAGGAIATNKKRRMAVPGAIDLNCMAVVANSQLDPRYLRLWFESLDLTSIADGSVLPQISKKKVLALSIPLPSLNEQKRIVEILEDHLSRLDAGNDAIGTAQRRAKALHKSVLMALIPDAGAYPDSWTRSTVEKAGKLELGRQRHPDWHTGPTMKPYLRVANVFEDRLDLRDVKEMHWPDSTFERFRLRPGDVLLNEGQSPELVGRPAIYRGEPTEVAFTNSLLRFQAGEHVLPEFALLVFRRHLHAGRFAREARITTNIAHLSAARLKPIEFPIPPLREQQRLVQFAREQVENTARLRANLTAVARRSAVLRRALLEAAFSGRLTGRDNDVDMIEEMAGV